MRVQALSRDFILFLVSNVLKKMLPFWNFWIKVKQISVVLLKVLNPKLLHDTSMNAGFQCGGGYLDYPVVCCFCAEGVKAKTQINAACTSTNKIVQHALNQSIHDTKKRTGFLF